MAPTFYIEKPHPPAEMFGVLGYECVKREHKKAWAAASPEVQAEARRYADHVLRNRSWSHPAVTKKLLTEHEAERLHLWIHGSTDYAEELVASARAAGPDDLFMPIGTCGYAPGMSIVEVNLDQKFPLTPECLEESDCKCHPAMPEYRVQRPLNIPDCIVISSEVSSAQDVSVSESEESPVPTADKGKGVDRVIFASETPDCTAVASCSAVASRLISCSKDAYLDISVSSTLAIHKSKSVEKKLAMSDAIPHGVEDDTDSNLADALSIQSDPPLHSDIRQEYPSSDASNLASPTTFSEDIQQGKDISPTTSTLTTPLAQGQTAASEKSKKKVYTCQWSKYFGGPCNYKTNTAQSHDRHVVTHIPGEDGYQVMQHKCTICGREFARKCSFQRHVKSVHKKDDPDRYWEEATRPWYWPELLFASESMKMKPRAEPPSDNELMCIDKIGQILDEYKINSAMKRSSDEGVIRNTIHSSGRPRKRRKIG